MVISEMLPKPALLAMGTEREGCLCHAQGDLAGGGLLEGVETGKSHIHTVFTPSPLCPSPLCPRVLFCPLVLNLAYSDLTQQKQCCCLVAKLCWILLHPHGR